MIRHSDTAQVISFVLDHLFDLSPLGGLLSKPSVISDPVSREGERQ